MDTKNIQKCTECSVHFKLNQTDSTRELKASLSLIR